MKTYKNAKEVMTLLDVKERLAKEQKDVAGLPNDTFAEVHERYGVRGVMVAKSMIAASIADELKEVEAELRKYVCTKYEDLAPVLLKLCDKCMCMTLTFIGMAPHDITPDLRNQAKHYAEEQIVDIIKYIQKEV